MTRRTAANVTVTASVLLCIGCTGTPNQQDAPREDRIYRTGSNLPSKDYGTVKTADPEALRDAARRNSAPGTGVSR